MNNKIKFKLDSADFQAALKEVTESAAQLPPQVINLLLDRINLLLELASFKNHGTVGTDCIIRLEPSDFLRDLLLASRTNDFEQLIVKYSHINLPLIQ